VRPGDAPPGPDEIRVGRIERVRSRAERAAIRYQELARRHPSLGLPLVLVSLHTARQGVMLASALAFRLFAWLVPLALLLAGILAAVAAEDSEDIGEAARAAGITGAASREMVTALKEAQRSWWLAILIGAVLFLWATRKLMTMLTSVHAHVWQVPPAARNHREIVVNSLVFDVAWLVLLGVALAIRRVDHLIPAGLLVSIVVEGMVVAGAWLLVSLRLPDGRERWTDLVPGCLLLGGGLAVLHAVSRIYIPNRLDNSSQLYGSLGIAIVILFWLLLIAELMVVAALLNVVLVDYRAGAGRR
jgi:uncharacterized BrkB/YihY/UPF0761 family membrane protein